jgi:hypothetical protein
MSAHMEDSGEREARGGSAIRTRVRMEPEKSTVATRVCNTTEGRTQKRQHTIDNTIMAPIAPEGMYSETRYGCSSSESAEIET